MRGLDARVDAAAQVPSTKAEAALRDAAAADPSFTRVKMAVFDLEL